MLRSDLCFHVLVRLVVKCRLALANTRSRSNSLMKTQVSIPFLWHVLGRRGYDETTAWLP